METPQHGLIIYRASRLEALLQPLIALMKASPPDRVLAPHSVIAAHPGMQRWLSRELALQRGPRGIVANLRIELPSEWLDRLAQQVLGEEAIALRPYRREVLRWRIHECLDAIADARVSAYLGADAASRAQRRFQLADRLARIYTRYLVYRPDWLRDWADGRGGAPADPLLAPLWKMLRHQIGLPHRGETLARLIRALSAAAPAPHGDEPLHVFGIAHLAPSELEVLRAVARHRPVVLYVPDPCREFWGGLRTDRQRLRELLRRNADDPEAEQMFLEQNHPLLASWGRMGQHFMLALDDILARSDERHWQDQVDAPQLDTRLHRVQESIRQLDPALIGEAADANVARADASLRIHACHTRLRELEVLRDALLRARADNPRLRPAEMVVMMPQIQAYLPLLPSVFGEAGKHDGPLPYHCFDVAVARSHSLFAAFRQLLDLPQSRLTAPEVVDLLGVPAIARRLDLSGGDVGVISGWLERSRVAWALDAAFRERFGVPAIAEHTFAWGIDRLLAGYLIGCGDDDESAAAITLPDTGMLLPIAGIHGPAAELVGALDTLLVELDAWCGASQRPRPASDWALFLEQRIEALFLVDPADRNGREARSLLLHLVRALAAEPAESGFDPLLEFSVVREVLLDRLDAVPERQRFLLGGVTFCGMVPQRAIPFRFVAVLGLNDGEFPRASSDGGLDLMTTLRRPGDRDVRSDDRYLFLETLMSARERLHLSFVGEGARDGKARNPAAPVAELMAALDAATANAQPAGDQPAPTAAPARPWFIQHPLQPFDERYFNRSDVRLFSFQHDFARMHGHGSERSAAAAFVDSTGARAEEPGASAGITVALADVLAYFRNPAKQLLAGTLKLRLDALNEDRLLESEPLEARFEALDQVAKRLFFTAIAQPDQPLPEAAPQWLRLAGLLPPGRIGLDAWEKEKSKVQDLLAAVAGHALFAGGIPPPGARTLACRVGRGAGRGAFLVQGELTRCYATDAADWIMDLYPGRDGEAKLDFKARIGFFLEWALRRLQDPYAERSVRACVAVAGKRAGWEHSFNAFDDAFAAAGSSKPQLLAQLEQRVAGLLEFWWQSQQQPQWYFPATSWAALGEDAEKSTRQWLGDFGKTGERDYAPGYARLLAGVREFEAGDDYAALCANAKRLQTLITLPLPSAS